MKKHDNFIKSMIYVISFLGVTVMLSVFGFIIYKSVYFFQHYSFSKFMTGNVWNVGSNHFGIVQILLGNFFVLLISLAIALPLTIFTSCFIVDYLSFKWKKRVINIVQILAGIPSVVFGLFALSVLSKIFVGLGAESNANLILTAVTLAFMGLPIMIALTVNALESVPNNLRYSALALGLTKEYVTFKIVLRSVKFKVAGAIMLGITRIIGETMAVLMICGNNPSGPNLHHGLNGFLFSTIATLASIIGLEALESVNALHTSALYAIGVILIVLVTLINIIILGLQYKKTNCRLKRNTKSWIYRLEQHKFNKRFRSTQPNPSEVRRFDNSIFTFMMNKSTSNNRWKKTNSTILKSFMLSSTFLVIGFVFTILISVFWNGLFKMHWPDLISVSSKNGGAGILATFAITILLIILTLVIVTPFALLLGIYMSEYSSQHGFMNKTLRFITTIFTATPSIVYGLFGLVFVIGVMHIPISVLAASITLAVVIMPMLTNNIESALQNVPSAYRTAAYSLGLNRSQTLRKIVLPNALPGITTGIILAITRVISESAPVYLTLGTAVFSPSLGFMSPGASMAVRILMLWKNGGTAASFRMMYEIAVVIIIMMLLLNLLFQTINKSHHYDYVKQPWKNKIQLWKEDWQSFYAKSKEFFNKLKIHHKSSN